jgi:hypothetical protein
MSHNPGMRMPVLPSTNSKSLGIAMSLCLPIEEMRLQSITTMFGCAAAPLPSMIIRDGERFNVFRGALGPGAARAGQCDQEQGK